MKFKTVFSVETTLTILIVVLLSLGIAPTLITQLNTPSERVFTLMHGYSDDFIGYTSFIKEGMDGKNTMTIRSLPTPQGVSSIHIVYVWIGKILGLLPIESTHAYHLANLLFGTGFILLTFKLFQHVWSDRLTAFWSTMIACTSTGVGYLTHVNDRWWYEGFISYRFIDNVHMRILSRPHYLIGACIFIYLITALITTGKPDNRKTGQLVLFFILSFLLSIIHLPSGLIVLLFSIIYSLLSVLSSLLKMKHLNTKNVVDAIRNSQFVHWQFILILLGSLFGLLVSQLSMGAYPYINLYPSVPKEIVNLPLFHPASFSYLDIGAVPNDILALGPVFWLSIPGLLLSFFFKDQQFKRTIFTLWFIVQCSLYFLLYPGFHVERVRFIQTLFFIPMTYGAMITLRAISHVIIKKLSYRKPLSPLAPLSHLVPSFPLSLLSLLLLFLFIPQHIFLFQQNTYAFTDFKNFSFLIFPTLKQKEIYDWLDTNTPKESRVLADYEAANHILLYSHNYVWGNPQNWIEGPREEMVKAKNFFFWGVMPDAQALLYLEQHGIDYIYYGYQEKTFGDITHYSFLKPVFQNEAAVVFKVSSNLPK